MRGTVAVPTGQLSRRLRVKGVLLDVVRDVLLAQMADQLDVLPGHAVPLLALHHGPHVPPPLGSRAALLGSGLGPEVGVRSPGGIR